jgi:glutamate-ammonia-ligase adenylyltransferase
MRARLDRERPAKSPWDLKESKGGLFDVEFIAQGLQLVHAAENSDLLHTNTLDALSALEEAGVLAAGDADLLTRATRLYQSVTQITRLTVEGAFNALEASASLRALIARAAALPSLEEVEAALTAAEEAVRACFTRLIGPL